LNAERHHCVRDHLERPRSRCSRWSLLVELNAERHHCVRDHLERPRRKRSQRLSKIRATVGRGYRSELRAAIGRVFGTPTPLASEHHGDDHLETLQAIAAVSMAE
jgi:hypothetical protein